MKDIDETRQFNLSLPFHSIRSVYKRKDSFENVLESQPLKLEQLIASSCRQKILIALSNTKGTHVTNLVRIINSTYNQVNRNLQILENEGIIKTKHYGHLKIIELEKENPKTEALLKALHILNGPTINNIANQHEKSFPTC